MSDPGAPELDKAAGAEFDCDSGAFREGDLVQASQAISFRPSGSVAEGAFGRVAAIEAEDTVCLQRRVADLTGASSPRRGPEPHRSPARPASPTWCARRESPPRTDGQSLESDLHPVSFLGEANVSVAVPSPVSRGGTGSLH